MLGEAYGAAGEAGDTPREFYEFVLPPVDIHEDQGGLTVTADVPGFAMEDISVRVSGDLLTIRAERRGGDAGTKGGRAVSLQRPRRLDKTVRLPARTGGPAATAGGEACTATCAGGVLTVRIPRGGRQGEAAG